MPRHRTGKHPRPILCAGVAALLVLSAACASVPAPAPLTLDEKIGQLFVYASTARFMNEASPEYRALVHQVAENHVGGVMWFLYSDVLEAAFLNGRLQALARTPLLLAADLEAGLGMRFHDTTYWPWPMALGATGDPSLAEREGRFIAREAREIGLNQIYAPVADVNINPENPVINVRSFGEDPEQVGRFVAAFVRGLQSEGVLATVKHFPGHGDTRTDSHRSLPVLEATPERLASVELVPFRAAIAAGVSSVMTAHLSIPSLDPTLAPVRPGAQAANPYTKDPAEASRNATMPACLSEPVTTGLLRRKLGFGGLVVTDALDMGGITDHFDPGEAAVRAVLAGADQVLKSPDLDAAIAGVRQAVASGRIPRARLDDAVAHVLSAKKRLRPAAATSASIFQMVDRPEHRSLAQEIARRSITLVREEASALPLRRDARTAHIVVSDVPRFADDLTGEIRARLAAPPAVFLIDSLSTDRDVDAALTGAAAADQVVLSIFVRFQSGKGSIAMPPAGKTVVQSVLAGRSRAVVAVFGSPYVLSEMPAARTAIVAWGSQSDEQTAAAKALFGEAAIEGRLPVSIPGIAARGAGIQKAAGMASGEIHPTEAGR